MIFTAADYARKRRSLAVRVAVLGFGLLLGGLFLNSPRTQPIALFCLVAGTLASWFGIALMDRWVAVPRAEVALAAALADAGPLFTLYNWALPAAEHVIVAPWGLAVVHVFSTEGPIDIDGARWRDRRPLWRRFLAFGRRAVRNPSPLIDADIAALRAAVVATGDANDALRNVPIIPVVVFTRPGLVLTTNAPTPMAVRATELRGWLRDEGRRQSALAPGEARRLKGVVAGMAEGRLGGAAPVG
ncbi:MAG: hypothetical protein IPG72_12085 [Ardenticatenales bacterium]|nr:hypothetical protein [Ardenticatenales bacterium]